jgi:hypothetical protein
MHVLVRHPRNGRHSCKPARRSPSANVARSCDRRMESQSPRLEMRSVGSSSRKRLTGGLLAPCSSQWTCMRWAIGSRRLGRNRTSCCYCQDSCWNWVRLSGVPFLDHRVIANRDGRDHSDLCGSLARRKRGRDAPSALDVEKAMAAGLASGVTTMVAHSGGPPLAMYLMPLGLSQELYAGTTSLFFTIGNATKGAPCASSAIPAAAMRAALRRANGGMASHEICRLSHAAAAARPIFLAADPPPLIRRG